MKGHYSFYFLKKLWPFVVLTFLLSSCAGNRKILKAVERDLTTSEVFKNGFTGFAIYDPENEKMIYEYNSEKYFIPASNTKLFTFYTGLKILCDSVPGIRYTVKKDSLIFTGTGDPSLLHKDLPASRVPDFLKNSEKKLFYLPLSYAENGLGPGWAWDDYNATYSAEISGFPVAGNTVIFSFPKGQATPEIFPKTFSDSTQKINYKAKRIQVKRDPDRNIFRYIYTSEEPDYQQKVPFKTSEETTLRILEDTIQKRIEILTAQPNLDLEKVLFSIQTDSLYKRLLQQSDNFIAEQILLMAAQEIGDSLKTKIAIDYMKENFLKDLPQEPKWVDGSGLSRYNLQTPANMVKILEKILGEISRDRLFKLLPEGGVSGTLKNQFISETPYIYAKTGSLSNNYSLSGYIITTKGQLLIFSFMNSNYMMPSSELKSQMEEIIQEIRQIK